MKNTTLCYLERDGCYLMLHRTKKEQDENAGKWVGVGGKFEPGESPDACLVREVREETGLALQSWHFHGVVSFLSMFMRRNRCFCLQAKIFPARCTNATRASWPGWERKRWRACLCGRGTGCSSGFWNRGRRPSCLRCATKGNTLCRPYAMEKRAAPPGIKSSEYGSAPCAQALWPRAGRFLFGKENRRHAGGYHFCPFTGFTAER